MIEFLERQLAKNMDDIIIQNDIELTNVLIVQKKQNYVPIVDG